MSASYKSCTLKVIFVADDFLDGMIDTIGFVDLDHNFDDTEEKNDIISELEIRLRDHIKLFLLVICGDLIEMIEIFEGMTWKEFCSLEPSRHFLHQTKY